MADGQPSARRVTTRAFGARLEADEAEKKVGAVPDRGGRMRVAIALFAFEINSAHVGA